jgi:hypothetical protein
MQILQKVQAVEKPKNEQEEQSSFIESNNQGQGKQGKADVEMKIEEPEFQTEAVLDPQPVLSVPKARKQPQKFDIATES